MTANLSDNQARIYSFIQEYTRSEGRPPTNREIGAAVSIASTGHVDYHLTVLERKGLIQRDRRKSRGIRIAQPDMRGLTIAGTIAAGEPLDIYQDEPREALDLGAHTREYVLLVRGDSMVDDHIASGDYVLIDPDAYVSEGDIIVATRKTGSGDAGAATLKRLYRETGRIRLQPANATMDPIYVAAAEWDREWEVQGKVTAVYRRC
ncbi:MAG TPA: transcriptional repressor LexA [Ktedonobacterales bacterium]|jgi:repressor LexA|nr:transcriptional repressor LexA [Ktedonobacterales bacterium]